MLVPCFASSVDLKPSSGPTATATASIQMIENIEVLQELPNKKANSGHACNGAPEFSSAEITNYRQSSIDSDS